MTFNFISRLRKQYFKTPGRKAGLDGTVECTERIFSNPAMAGVDLIFIILIYLAAHENSKFGENSKFP